MDMGYFKMSEPVNERSMTFEHGSAEANDLMAEVERQSSNVVEIPCIIGGKEVFTGNTSKVVEPHRHSHVIANFHKAGEKELKDAIDAAMAAKEEWMKMPWEHRAAIFLKAADILAGPRRMMTEAACMLGQSKNMWEAEIDICELVDFLRFNTYLLQKIYCMQPMNTEHVSNRVEYRPLEGFVAALTPFNFTSIGGNLCTAPAICGNTVVWKPSSTACLSNYYLMKVLMEAGMPAGVINFVPCAGSDFSKYVTSDRRMSGFHFTGSTEVFNSIWRQTGENIERYMDYPRLVGETGGKDYVFAHTSADTQALVSGIVSGAFSYAGQKCSATSRAYIPESIWPEVRSKLHEAMKLIRTGDIRDRGAFLNAVIDARSFRNIKNFIEDAKKSQDAEIIEGGKMDDSIGYFVEPTVILAKKPDYESMEKEIFGPVLTVYVYPDDRLGEMLKSCSSATKYGLTGSLYANDRSAIVKIEKDLIYSAGNFYINDKTTGATVGQQPFGGSRGSGTNEKTATITNMMRWLSQRTIKENRLPEKQILLPHMM